jgi:hypothetical protein
MAARAGMANLISRWRRLVGGAGTAVFTDDEAQEILDAHRRDLVAVPLTMEPHYAEGVWEYKVYHIGAGNLEEASSGADAWEMRDANGMAIGTALYTVDYLRGRIVFGADQAGSARYLTCRAYDLNGAAAQGWRELQGEKAELYTYSGDGRTFSRGQWFDHCERMAAHYERKAWLTVVSWERSDCNA